jgi:uncharacterized protein (TIGR03437 family)
MQPTPAGLNRRHAMLALGGAGASLLLFRGNNAVAQTFDCILSPEMTEGPYWVEEKLNRGDVRSNTATGAVKAGLPVELSITVHLISDTGCAVLPGAYVDIWHCDAGGLYSDVQQNNTVGQDFLRGYQITDENGVARFTTIYPGWYQGRTVHIHLRVRTYNGSQQLDGFVSQLFFDDSITDSVFTQAPYNTRGSRSTRNANDNIYGGRTSTLVTLTQSASGYSASIDVGVDLTTPPATAPRINSGGVVSAASNEPGVAPQGFVSIYGAGLAETTRSVGQNDLVNGVLPTTLAGVSVQINQKAAYLYYISPSQLNVQAPLDETLGTVDVTVANEGGTSAAVTANLQTFQPAFFLIGDYVAAVRSDGMVVPTDVSAAPGDALQIYATGFGPTDPEIAPGGVFAGASYELADDVMLTIGGMPVTVEYAGLVATGLYQLNLTVPALASGDHEVVATVGGVSSPEGPLLKIA